MESEVVRGDVQTTGNDFKRIMNAIFAKLARMLQELFLSLFKKGKAFLHQRHMAGWKRITKDGPTKEMDGLSNLSYDDVQKFGLEYQKAGVEFVIKPEKSKVDNKVLHKASNANIDKFLKTRKKLDKALNKLEKNPYSSRIINRVSKLQSIYDKQVEAHKGLTYSIYTNMSKQAFNERMRRKYYEQKINFTDSELHDEIMEEIDSIYCQEYSEERFQQLKEKLLTDPKYKDLNPDQIREHFQSLKQDGTVDKEYFKDSTYFVQTVSATTAAKIANELESDGKDFTVTGTKDEHKMNIYIEDKDLPYYIQKGFADKGNFTHFDGNKHPEGVENRNPFENVNPSDLYKATVPISKVYEFNNKLKNEDYKMNIIENENGQQYGVFTFSYQQYQRMEFNEKKSDIDEKVKTAYDNDRERFKQAYIKKDGSYKNYIYDTNIVDVAMNRCNRELTDNELNDFYYIARNGSKDEFNSYINKINSTTVNKEVTRATVDRDSIKKMPAEVTYDTLSPDVKSNLNKAYGFKDNAEAKSYFDKHKLEFGTYGDRNDMGIVISDIDNKNNDEFISFSEYSRMGISNSEKTPEKDNVNTLNINNNNSSNDSKVEFDIEFDDKE